MSSREQDLELALQQLRDVLGNLIEHLQSGGNVRRNDALHRDLKRVHRHTRDVMGKRITGGASRWWEKTLGERVVSLEAELERMKVQAVQADRHLEAGKVLGALSDEAVASEYDRRELRVVSARRLREYETREYEMYSSSPSPQRPVAGEQVMIFGRVAAQFSHDALPTLGLDAILQRAREMSGGVIGVNREDFEMLRRRASEMRFVNHAPPTALQAGTPARVSRIARMLDEHGPTPAADELLRDAEATAQRITRRSPLPQIEWRREPNGVLQTLRCESCRRNNVDAPAGPGLTLCARHQREARAEAERAARSVE